jgi:translocation and assembly module TamB
VRWPEWPGRLGGEVSLRGGLQDGKPDARLDIRTIDGVLRDYPLKVRGALGLRGDTFEADGVELTSGSSRLTAQGTLSQAWDLQWTLVSDDLASLWPGAAGRIDAGGTLSGDRALPLIFARVSGSKLGMEDHRVATLEGSFTLDLGKGDRFDTLVQVTGLESAGRTWEVLELKGSGNRAAHRLNISLSGGLPDFRAALDGGLPVTGGWRGRLTQLDLDGRELGIWRLEKPVALVLSGKRMSLERTCLLEAGGSLCFSASRPGDGTLQGKADLDNFALAWLGALAPDLPELDGLLNAAMDFKIDAAGEVSGRLTLDIPRGLARLNLYGREEELDYSGSRIRALADDKGVEAEVDFSLKRGGGLEGRLALPGWSIKQPDRPGQPLKGSLKANLEDLGSFSALVPNLAQLRGRIEADLKVSGTFSQPGIKGFARLSGAGFELAQLGLKLESMELEARNRGLNEILYRGGLLSGEGRLEIGGSTRLDPSQGWPTRLTLKGQDLTVADVPEAWMLVSPDLQLDMVNRRVGLKGEIFVPRARIRPRTLPDTAIAPSPDVRFIDARGEVVEQDPLQVNASIRLRLGDQVSFDGFGVRGLIRGNLLLTDAPGRPTLGNGQVSIEEGVYRAYGQDLRIRQGRAIFANSLITDPGIAVNAVRQVQDVEVGLNVSGTLKKPVLEIFSSPAMAQSDALSYLLLGRPMGRTTSSSDRDAVQSAGSALAAGGGNLLGAEIGRQFGLDELSFQSAGEDGEDIALQVGAYLSPRLYIQYVTELAAASNQVKLRYDLTERIQVQTETGTVHGADIFYTIER